ncbi:MAG: LysR family transcriptional regulator [Clostridia bacterium]|nr:LysR family transcriptional regulator [Clostridia bacterium]
MVNLELYRVFYTVAKSGSLTKAAQELYISQPAVSQSIKQIESQLGVALFNRTHRGMELSIAGRSIYHEVEEALGLLDEAEDKITVLNATATGTIRIGATDSIFYYILADRIAQYNEKYPGVKLELVSSTSPYTLSQLKEGKCDVGFINLPIDDDEVKFYGTVALLSDVFVAGKKYEPELRGKKIGLRSLQEMPLLMIEENTIARRALASFTSTLGITLNPVVEAANWDLMKKLVINGMGIGCIPREYCTKQLERGDLFELDTDPAMPVRGVGLCLPKNVPLSFAMREFVSMFTGKNTQQ